MPRKLKSRIKELKREPGSTARTTGGLFRKTAYFTESEWAAIRQVAFEADVSYAEILRKAIQEYLGLPAEAQRRGPKKSS